MASRLWALANWSRFVRPGATRIGTDGGEGLRIAAFKNVDDSIAVVLISQGGEGDVIISAGDAAPGGIVKAWVSDDTRQCEETEVTGDGGEIVVNVAASSITTVHFAAAVAEQEPAEDATDETEEETPGEGEVPVESEEAAEP